MPLSNLLTASILLDVLRTGRAGFGVPLIAVELATSVVPNRTLIVSQLTDLTDLGVLTTDPVYLAMAALIGQERRPTQVVIGRRLAEVAQVTNITIDGTDDGDYVVTLGGTPFTYAASGAADTVIRDGLIALIDADAAYGAVAGAGTSIDITAAQAGLAFTATVEAPNDGLGDPTTSTPNVGLYEDLAAFRAEYPGFYGVLDVSHTDHAIREGGRFAADQFSATDGIPILFAPQSNSVDILDPADDTDVFSELNGLVRHHVMPIYHSNDAEYVDAAILGKMLPTDPGSANWAWQTLSGVTANDLSASNVAALQAKRVNYVESIGTGPTFFEGFCCGGYYADQIRGADKLRDEVLAALTDLLQGSERVDFLADGLDQVDDTIETAARRQAFVVPESIEVTGLEADEIPGANLAIRDLPPRVLTAQIRTPINRVSASGTLTLSNAA